MSESKISVGASYSRKVSDGNYGTVEASEWETRELPGDASQEVVDAMKSKLRRIVEEKVEETIERKLAPKTPQDVPTKAGSSVEAKRTSVAYNAPQTIVEGTPRVCVTPSCKGKPTSMRRVAGKEVWACYPCATAYRNGAVPAKPVEKVPDGPNGEPFIG